MLGKLFKKKPTLHNVKTHSIDLGGVDFVLESGKLAHLADGSVTVTYGDTVLLATAGMSDTPREGIDFFPLMCDFEAKYYATGKMKGSKFSKREARPADSAILTARLIDRPLRPMFPKGMQNDVQLIVTLLQAKGDRSVAAEAITAASTAVQLSGIPIEAPVAAVRVGMDEDGNFFLNPTYEQAEKGLDLIIAGSADAILMVEAGANLIADEKMLEAFEYAHEQIKKLCQAQEDFKKQFEIKAKTPSFAVENEAAIEAVNSVLTEKDYASIGGTMKKDYKASVHAVEERLLSALEADIEAEKFTKGDLLKVMGKNAAKFMRKNIFEKNTRLDGRKPDEIRPLYTEVGLYPRLHGTGLFQRGDTQALSIVTLAGPGNELILDDAGLDGEHKQTYMHHYNFPPYSVGEVRPMRGTGRREIGHGALGERALKYMVPTAAEGFPYTVRVVSEILACNGSSSMAAVCGQTLSLMDAGVPIKAPIAGIAMGLVTDENGNYTILTDIQGAEDFDGDMDLKVCGDENGLTSLQMDIKLKGLKMSLLKEALEKAKIARTTILKNMKETIPAPRETMSEFAPRVISFKIEDDDIRVVIGKGGETIQGLCAEHNVTIDISDDAVVAISGVGEAVDVAKAAIDKMLYKPQVGDVFENCTVKSIMDFGAFVEYLPGKEALVHVSEIANERVNNVHDYLKEGQKVAVKITGFDKKGREQLSMKALLKK
ncbi:polyribonucleotide nucleotidyltransferase [bacterium DOLZORAL124_38_8]|nr:MAG: polyribonucleotide nucleotidyltransferase [bacterium DOLZORAL124_38_8]